MAVPDAVCTDRAAGINKVCVRFVNKISFLMFLKMGAYKLFNLYMYKLACQSATNVTIGNNL